MNYVIQTVAEIVGYTATMVSGELTSSDGKKFHLNARINKAKDDQNKSFGFDGTDIDAMLLNAALTIYGERKPLILAAYWYTYNDYDRSKALIHYYMSLPNESLISYYLKCDHTREKDP